MYHFSFESQVMILIITYLSISLITLLIRSVLESLGLSRIGFWVYLWPRLRLWLIGVLCFTLILIGANIISKDKEGVMFQNLFYHLGIFAVIPIVVGGYAVLCIFLGIFAPLSAIISEHYEID